MEMRYCGGERCADRKKGVAPSLESEREELPAPYLRGGAEEREWTYLRDATWNAAGSASSAKAGPERPVKPQGKVFGEYEAACNDHNSADRALDSKS